MLGKTAALSNVVQYFKTLASLVFDHVGLTSVSFSSAISGPQIRE